MRYSICPYPPPSPLLNGEQLSKEQRKQRIFLLRISYLKGFCHPGKFTEVTEIVFLSKVQNGVPHSSYPETTNATENNKCY